MLRSRRPAVVLAEALTVVAVLATLAALLVPALARARLAQKKASSVNNLKQIGIACHNYHDADNIFPPGNDALNFSVAAQLLPYVEHEKIYKQINFTKPITDNDNAAARKELIDVFLNPDDKQKAPNKDYGATSYLFSAGSQPALKDGDGIFYQDSKLRIVSITDGTSNTVMAAETLRGDGSTKAADVKRQHVVLKAGDLKGLKDDAGVEHFKAGSKNIAGDRCASWMDGRFLQGTYTATLRPNDARPDVDCAGLGGLSAVRSLKDNVTLLFADGSVQTFNSKKIPTETWKAIHTRAGGEVVSLDF